MKDEELQRERLARKSRETQQTRMDARTLLPQLEYFVTTEEPKRVSNWLGRLCVAYCTEDKKIEVVLKS